jgi:3-methyl-2-oxobutanoate hydroxymethyltransferase
MKGQTPIVCLTAYSAPIATLLDAHIDCFIVGDSLGMVCYGLPSTLGVSLDMMIRHGRTVVENSQRACVVVDLPFGSYQASPAEAFTASARILGETGAQAVKLEGGEEMAETVAFLTQRGIPVMAHIGLKPQHLNTMGGYKYQGRGDDGANRVLNDARIMQQSGSFALLLEGIAEPVARAVTETSAIPTIGIGASPQCDGQVLVTDDLLGLTPKTPKFVKQYAALAETINQAVADYASDVRARKFPDMSHCFGVKKG